LRRTRQGDEQREGGADAERGRRGAEGAPDPGQREEVRGADGGGHRGEGSQLALGSTLCGYRTYALREGFSLVETYKLLCEDS
jgi:hypothetical protein